VANATSRPLDLQKRDYLMGEPQGRSGRFAEDKNLLVLSGF